MEAEQKLKYLENVLEKIDLPENLKTKALESEEYAHKEIMERIINED